ncbi:MAG: hypothetical protein ABIF92_02810 [archaeon]
MTKKKIKIKDKCCAPIGPHQACGGGLYGLGFIGALIYYTSTAASFWWGVLGILKSMIWPVFLVYEALKFLGA